LIGLDSYLVKWWKKKKKLTWDGVGENSKKNNKIFLIDFWKGSYSGIS
jgi:hypothetical protein